MKVKKTLLGILALALPALVVSCSKDGDNPTPATQGEVSQGLKKMVFTAELPESPLGEANGLRTTLASDGRTVNWTLGDNIAIFAVTSENEKKDVIPTHAAKITKVVDGTKIIFDSETVGEAKAYYAIYPYIQSGVNANNPVFERNDEDVTSPHYYHATLQANQQALLGSYASQTAVSIAKRGDDGIFRFKNATALLKIQFSKDASMVGEDVTEIRLSVPVAGLFTLEALAGRLSIEPVSGSSYAFGSTFVSLTNGGQAIQPTFGDKGYYMVLASSSTGSNFILDFKTSKGRTITKKFSTKTPFAPNKIKSINVTGLGASTETIIEAIDLSGQAGDFEQ